LTNEYWLVGGSPPLRGGPGRGTEQSESENESGAEKNESENGNEFGREK